MVWYNLGLIALIVSLALTAGLSSYPRLWVRARVVASFALRLSAVFIGTWLLISVAARVSTGLVAGGVTEPAGIVLAGQVLVAGARSIALLAVAVVWGTSIGLGTAYMQYATRKQRLPILWLLATLLWVMPTFLLGIFAQEMQAQIFQHSGYVVTGGYGTASPLQVFWAGVVLGIRPATYIYRHSYLAMGDQRQSEHVRTAIAKGMPWTVVVRKHILRPSLSTITAGWLNSFRLMIGSLPLIEWFFAYPGLGQQLIYSLGIARPDQVGAFQPDVAIAFVVGLAVVLVLIETIAHLLQQVWDPRLTAVRVES